MDARLVGASVALWAALSTVGVEAVGQSRSVEERHRQGMELRAQHRDSEALEVFRSLWRETREPRAQARMGLAEAALGQWVLAERDLTGALSESTDAWVSSFRERLEQELASVRAHVGGLLVECSVEGAEVSIGGERVATLPMREPLRVPSGEVSLVVRAAGYSAGTSRVRVRSGAEPTRVRVALLAERPSSNVGGGEARGVARRPEAPSPERRQPPGDDGATLRGLGIASLVGAGVGAGVGVVGLLMRNGQAVAFRDSGCLLASNADVVLGVDQFCRERFDTGQTWEAVSVAGFVAGGALAVTGIMLLVAAPSRTREVSAAVSFGCGAGPGNVGVACGGRF